MGGTIEETGDVAHKTQEVARETSPSLQLTAKGRAT